MRRAWSVERKRIAVSERRAQSRIGRPYEVAYRLNQSSSIDDSNGFQVHRSCSNVADYLLEPSRSAALAVQWEQAVELCACRLSLPLSLWSRVLHALSFVWLLIDVVFSGFVRSLAASLPSASL